MVSYFQAGKMCDYIAERWGDDALLGMIHSFGDRKTTEQAIQENLHESPEQFDKDFSAWLDKQTRQWSSISTNGKSRWNRRMLS